MFKQGDVLLVKFPFGDINKYKTRPAIVVSNSNLKESWICAMITTQDKFSIKIGDDELDVPLKKMSFVKTGNLFTPTKNGIVTKISVARTSFLRRIVDEICKNLKVK